MSQTPQNKNRYQASVESQEDFVNSIADTMVRLSKQNSMGGSANNNETATLGFPYCPMTGREYSGANMTRLLLASMDKGYQDNRWMSFKQLEKYQSDHPALDVHIRKGEKGIKILRPEAIAFIIDNDGKQELLSKSRLEEIETQKLNGVENLPIVHKSVLFYPYTVFNAEQVEGFPQKERTDNRQSNDQVNKSDIVNNLLSCSGVRIQYHAGEALYSPDNDTISLPHPERFKDDPSFDSKKLHEFFHATGHSSREGRQEQYNLKSYALEEIRSSVFTKMTSSALGIQESADDSSKNIELWNKKFNGGEARAMFKAVTEAGKMLALVQQFSENEQPTAKWFPPRTDWLGLMAENAKSQEQYISETKAHVDVIPDFNQYYKGIHSFSQENRGKDYFDLPNFVITKSGYTTSNSNDDPFPCKWSLHTHTTPDNCMEQYHKDLLNFKQTCDPHYHSEIDKIFERSIEQHKDIKEHYHTTLDTAKNCINLPTFSQYKEGVKNFIDAMQPYGTLPSGRYVVGAAEGYQAIHDYKSEPAAVGIDCSWAFTDVNPGKYPTDKEVYRNYITQISNAIEELKDNSSGLSSVSDHDAILERKFAIDSAKALLVSEKQNIPSGVDVWGNEEVQHKTTGKEAFRNDLKGDIAKSEKYIEHLHSSLKHAHNIHEEQNIKDSIHAEISLVGHMKSRLESYQPTKDDHGKYQQFNLETLKQKATQIKAQIISTFDNVGRDTLLKSLCNVYHQIGYAKDKIYGKSSATHDSNYDSGKIEAISCLKNDISDVEKSISNKTKEWGEDRVTEKRKALYASILSENSLKNQMNNILDAITYTNKPALNETQTIVANYESAENPIQQIRMILNNPDLLEMALKQDPQSAKNLADLCSSFGNTLSMELDDRQNNCNELAQQNLSTRSRMK